MPRGSAVATVTGLLRVWLHSACLPPHARFLPFPPAVYHWFYHSVTAVDLPRWLHTARIPWFRCTTVTTDYRYIPGSRFCVPGYGWFTVGHLHTLFPGCTHLRYTFTRSYTFYWLVTVGLRYHLRLYCGLPVTILQLPGLRTFYVYAHTCTFTYAFAGWLRFTTPDCYHTRLVTHGYRLVTVTRLLFVPFYAAHIPLPRLVRAYRWFCTPPAYAHHGCPRLVTLRTVTGYRVRYTVVTRLRLRIFYRLRLRLLVTVRLVTFTVRLLFGCYVRLPDYGCSVTVVAVTVPLRLHGCYYRGCRTVLRLPALTHPSWLSPCRLRCLRCGLFAVTLRTTCRFACTATTTFTTRVLHLRSARTAFCVRSVHGWVLPRLPHLRFATVRGSLPLPVWFTVRCYLVPGLRYTLRLYGLRVLYTTLRLLHAFCVPRTFTLHHLAVARFVGSTLPRFLRLHRFSSCPVLPPAGCHLCRYTFALVTATALG